MKLRSLLPLILIASCSDDQVIPNVAEAPTLAKGELCDKTNRPELKLTFDPPNVVVGPGQTRNVKLTVEPDLCDPTSARISTANAAIAAAPSDPNFDLRHATYDFVVTGGGLGETSIHAEMTGKDANDKDYVSSIELPVEVRDAAAPTCAASDLAEGTLAAGSTSLAGKGALAKAVVSSNPNAFARTDEFSLPSFPVSVGCGTDLVSRFASAKLRKLGPAVSFVSKPPVSMGHSLRREVDVSIPVNPAVFPTAARLRHLVVLYTGAKVKDPRPVSVSSPRIEKDGDQWVLRFSTPWFGTYQAAVEEGAGSTTHKRHLTHRAVIGISMGGGGTATFGMRHHDKFDVMGPLGGPSDFTYLLWYIEKYALGGFCPAGQTCATTAPNRYAIDDPYAHTMDFEHWFYEKGSGNGGGFPRSEYLQLIDDLSLAMGSANGQNADPLLPHMVPGPKSTDPWITGGRTDGKNCSFTVDPIKDDPNQDAQRKQQDDCATYRCDPAHQWRAETGFYDDEYNPDGQLPVQTFCDGKQGGDSPYVDSWAQGDGNDKPVNLSLFVDRNKNGVRDPGEPILRSGHEAYEDCGADGLCDAQEPGYDAETNADPNQDDYDPVINPTGLEGNHRYDQGEKFSDFGLDGVPNTASIHVAGDPGENDGKYTESKGLTNFYAVDPHSIVNRRSKDIPGGELTDAALSRLDVLFDGGVRDLFNLGVVSSHLAAQIGGRRGANGLSIRPTFTYNGFSALPGEPADENQFNPTLIRWADVAAIPNVRYGNIDATKDQIGLGDGQHVGSVPQLLARLETSFFYVAKAWPDADRTLTEEARDNPYTGAPECEISGRCEHMFTGSAARTNARVGPVAVSLPPGYALQANVDRNVRYPVLYVLHGYGQDPRDLEAVAIFTNNFMNVAQRSYATRLAKFIIVYVDGRCRVDSQNRPECTRGTFYLDSIRPDGPKSDAWFDEVTDFIDKQYRTMPASDVDVTD